MIPAVGAVGQQPSGAEFSHAGAPGAAKRRAAIRAFHELFGGPSGWEQAPLVTQLAAQRRCGRFVVWLILTGQVRPTAGYLLACNGWLAAIGDRVHPQLSTDFQATGEQLGYPEVIVRRQWSALLLIAAVSRVAPGRVTAKHVSAALGQLQTAAADLGQPGIRNLSANTYGMQAVLFHLGLTTTLPPRAIRAGSRKHKTWHDIGARAPAVQATCQDYLDQMSVRLRPNSVSSMEDSLRMFAGYLVDHHTDVTRIGEVRRQHVQAYKTWLAARPGHRGTTLANATLRGRLGALVAFFARLDELDIQDAPPRRPILASDLPIRDEPLPRFIDDASSMKLLAATRAHPDLFTRTAIELLARTGMRSGELLSLSTDAVVQIGASHWLRVPVGKLHTDRYVPLHPQLKDLLDQWMRHRTETTHSNLLFLERGRRVPASRLSGALDAVAGDAGIGHVSPHQLRHTLATQAINRGMSLEAIAALLGHKSLAMTMVYARIADRTVADEYFAVSEKVEALYNQQTQRAGEALTETTDACRMLGNGFCDRPNQMDCQFETVCEACAFFATTIEFHPTLKRQRDDAQAKGQTAREKVFREIIERLEAPAS